MGANKKHVHGDIRHLETTDQTAKGDAVVHGDIRHLENLESVCPSCLPVHGDIRHLEIRACQNC